MVQLMKRTLVPARLRRVVLGWFDARYISRADHRQDIKDALWEVQTLSREIISLRAEVGELRAQVNKVRLDPAQAKRWDDAHRLSQETAVAMEQVLQNEVLLWQAVDRPPAGSAGSATAETSAASETSTGSMRSAGPETSTGSIRSVSPEASTGSTGSASPETSAGAAGSVATGGVSGTSGSVA
jgi:hypothetical protein